ncbi:UDP-glucuronosyl/UDP-glucosyltransferase [Artemisia annua]|uniref:UDP-glucuronosyl/UDP-glucosyltransferase n=1 Tax=Artemisia annua TaxID=35608 RepID=A0A2U1N8D7_ARTAN|nr:UDP-glucuronosyl/UDP-glucosyltransferase [Artemisia annua]
MASHGRDTTLVSTQSKKTQRRIIMFPMPYQGHLTPMLQLANILHNNGFKITFIHAQQNTPTHSNYPHITFKSIFDGFSEIGKYMPKEPDASFIITYLNENCRESFTHCLTELLAEPNEPPVACLITDAEYYFTQEVADSMKVPRIVMWACTIASVLVYGDLQFFYEKGYFNFTKQDSEYERPVPKYPILKVKDIIKIAPNPKGLGEYLTKVVKQIKASSGIIWNSFVELEEPTLETLNHDFPIPRFGLGPLQMYFPASPSNAQAPKSVIYLSFGSIARITKLEFLEVAYGLANIDFPFLWVVRPGVVKGSEWIEWLPEKFLEEVGDRGRIVKWCPQQEVLAHPSTGCFWTHSGWNSTLESICNEVPMICSPCVVGQPIIARYVNDIWKIGVLLEDGFERVGIETAVKRIMLNEEGEEIRKRISRVKKEVDVSFDEGGSSHRSLKSLIDYISSF